MTLEPSLHLVGMKHTGKSTIGRLWAQRRGWDFFDLDHLLEQTAGGTRTSREIFRLEGKSGFQQWESLAAQQVAPRLREGAAVLAWGGGTGTNPAAVQSLKGTGILVVLEDRMETLYERILRGGRPAFLSEAHPWEDFQKLYDERTTLFRQLTPWTLRVQDQTPEQAVDALEQLWNRITSQG